jgi:hypothetical protein
MGTGVSPYILRIPRLYGAEPGETGWSTAVALRDMRASVRVAREKGVISRADARREARVLEAAEAEALRDGRAPVAFDPHDVVNPLTKGALARRKKRKAQRTARKRSRSPKKKRTRSR